MLLTVLKLLHPPWQQWVLCRNEDVTLVERNQTPVFRKGQYCWVLGSSNVSSAAGAPSAHHKEN